LALHHHEELRSAAPGLVAALRKVMQGGKAGVRRSSASHQLESA
jgi:hypothetical protein